MDKHRFAQIFQRRSFVLLNRETYLLPQYSEHLQHRNAQVRRTLFLGVVSWQGCFVALSYSLHMFARHEFQLISRIM